MKKTIIFLSLLISINMLMVSCGDVQPSASYSDEEEIEVTTEYENVNDGTIEDNVEFLTSKGWKKTEEGYKKTTSNNECDGEYLLKVKKNDVDIRIKFKYKNNEDNIIKIYKDDAEIAEGVVAQWIMEIASTTGIYSGKANYDLRISDTKIAKGAMTFEDAFKIAETLE